MITLGRHISGTLNEEGVLGNSDTHGTNWRKERQRKTTQNIVNELVEEGLEIKKAKFIKCYKGLEIVETHDRLLPEMTHLLKKRKSAPSSCNLSRIYNGNRIDSYFEAAWSYGLGRLFFKNSYCLYQFYFSFLLMETFLEWNTKCSVLFLFVYLLPNGRFRHP